MGIIKEFKEFAMRGNVVDMAVGIIIGAAFGKIVSSFVADVLMPPLSMLLGQVNFTNWFVTMTGGEFATLEDAKAAGAVTLNYGAFINNVIAFALVTLVMFFLISGIQRLDRKRPAAAPNTKACPQCCTDIPLAAKRCPNCTSQL